MGAYMRYAHMFRAFDTIICMKVAPPHPHSFIWAMQLPYVSATGPKDTDIYLSLLRALRSSLLVTLSSLGRQAHTRY